MNKTQLANYFDHTFLKPYATEADLTKLCNEAKEIGAAMVAINTTWTRFCKEQLKGTNVHVGAAISFPLGQAGLASKIAETKIKLADYKTDTDKPVNTWIWFDLTHLKDASKITLIPSSSDSGEFGMNTGKYFCIDDLTLIEK